MGRHVLPQQLPYTWSGFVWVHVVIINCHVANSCVESLPIFIVLLKSADKTQRQTGQLHTHSQAVSILAFLCPLPTPQRQHVRAARPRLVHLLQPEYITHLIGVLQLRGRQGAGGGTELLKNHFSPFSPLSVLIGARVKKTLAEALFTVKTLFSVSKDNSIQFNSCPWKNWKGLLAQRKLLPDQQFFYGGKYNQTGPVIGHKRFKGELCFSMTQ